VFRIPGMRPVPSSIVTPRSESELTTESEREKGQRQGVEAQSDKRSNKGGPEPRRLGAKKSDKTTKR
jgi:hypothetical protein